MEQQEGEYWTETSLSKLRQAPCSAAPSGQRRKYKHNGNEKPLKNIL